MESFARSSRTGEEAGVVVAAVAAGTGNFGCIAQTREYVDLMEAGVVDPTKVTRTALQTAASVAGLLLPPDCAMSELPKDDAPMGDGTPGGMGGMGMDM